MCRSTQSLGFGGWKEWLSPGRRSARLRTSGGGGEDDGLDQNSVVCRLFLSTVAEAGITKVIGKLSEAMKVQLDARLKAILQLP